MSVVDIPVRAAVDRLGVPILESIEEESKR